MLSMGLLPEESEEEEQEPWKSEERQISPPEFDNPCTSSGRMKRSSSHKHIVGQGNT
jgi:hypothetical protein